MIEFLKVPYKDVYPVRLAAYGLLMKKDQIAIIKTPRGLFLPGGGIEKGESQEACIVREFKEELGMTVVVEAYVTTTKLTNTTPSRAYPIEMIGHCWRVKDMNEPVVAIEEDHQLVWLTIAEASRSLKLVHQAWVMEHLLAQEIQPTIVPYNPHWVDWFEAISFRIKAVLGDHYKVIEHLGSTAIPGMKAKPVIDMTIVIGEEEDFDDVCSRLSQLGYLHNGNQGIPGREVFKRSDEQEDVLLDLVPHHLYLSYEGGDELRRHCHFRDTLMKDDTLRDAYNALKEEIIAVVGPYDRKAYVEMKANDYTCFFSLLDKQ